MLKTNSKKAIENLKKYILENFNTTDYPEYQKTDEKDFAAVAKAIYDCFWREKYYSNDVALSRRFHERDIFIDWAQGLPSILDTGYFYNRSAVDDLGTILEETQEEKAKYTDRDAARLLTSLIYLQIKKAVK